MGTDKIDTAHNRLKAPAPLANAPSFQFRGAPLRAFSAADATETEPFDPAH